MIPLLADDTTAGNTTAGDTTPGDDNTGDTTGQSLVSPLISIGDDW